MPLDVHEDGADDADVGECQAVGSQAAVEPLRHSGHRHAELLRGALLAADEVHQVLMTGDRDGKSSRHFVEWFNVVFEDDAIF